MRSNTLYRCFVSLMVLDLDPYQHSEPLSER